MIYWCYEDSSSVTGWELATSVPPPFLLAELVDLLGVSLDYLLRGKTI